MKAKEEKKEQGFQTINNDIKTDKVGPALLFTGEEEYLIDWAVESIRSKYVDDSCLEIDFGKYDKYNGDEYGLTGFLEQCNLYPLLSQRKVMWLKDFKPLETEKVNPKEFSNAEMDSLINYLENPSENTILIISCTNVNPKSTTYNLIRKKTAFYDFSKLNHSQLIAFAAKRFKMLGVEVPRDGLDFIIQETGYFNRDSDYRLYNLIKDIEKIVAHSGGEKVREEDVIRTIHGDMETYVFDFLDGISKNRKDQAFTLLNNMFDSGADFFSLLGLLVNHFEFVLDVKELKEEGANKIQIAKELGAKDYRVTKAFPVAEKFSVKKLKSVLSELYEIDRKIKMGDMEQRMALELFVAGI